MGLEVRWRSGSARERLARSSTTGRQVLRSWVLTVCDDVVEFGGRHDGEAVRDDGVGGIVAVVVHQDFAAGRGHLGEGRFVFSTLELGPLAGGKTSWKVYRQICNGRGVSRRMRRDAISQRDHSSLLTTKGSSTYSAWLSPRMKSASRGLVQERQ